MKKGLKVFIALLLIIAIGCTIWYYSTFRYNLGLYSVNLISANTVYDSYYEETYLVVHYSFTNHTSSPVSFRDVIEHHAYQGGIELWQVLFYGSADIPHYSNYSQKVRPGVSIEVDVAYYILDDDAITTVEVNSPTFLWWYYTRSWDLYLGHPA